MHIQHCFHKQILIRLSCVMAMPAQLLGTEILQEKYAHFIHTRLPASEASHYACAQELLLYWM